MDVFLNNTPWATVLPLPDSYGGEHKLQDILDSVRFRALPHYIHTTTLFYVADFSPAKRGEEKMKRTILISTRQNKDEKTGDELLFLTLSKLPNKMNNGGLWYPKKDELIINTCINKSRSPEEYEKMLKVLPGALVDVTLGLNEYNNKVYVVKTDVVPGTDMYTEDMLYL